MKAFFRIFQKWFRIHFVDAMAIPQELDVVREEHNAQKDHLSGRHSESTINDAVATKRGMKGHLLSLL
jgi:hypothetical protein